MLNPIECFIEASRNNQDAADLLQEVQQFLEFNKDSILQNDQRKIINDPNCLLLWAYQVDELTTKHNQLNHANLVQVQLLLFCKFIILKDYQLDEHKITIFDALQRKTKLCRLHKAGEDVLAKTIEISRNLYQHIDQSKLPAIIQLLYYINLFDYQDLDNDAMQTLINASNQAKNDGKRGKCLLNQESHWNIIVYSDILLLQQCQRMVENNLSLDSVINICQQIKEDIKRYQNAAVVNQMQIQLNLCILLSYYKLNMVDEFKEYSNSIESNKSTPLEIQLIVLVVKIKQLVNEPNFEKSKQQLTILLYQFFDMNILMQINDIYTIITELAHSMTTHALAIYSIMIFTSYKQNQLLKLTNPQIIQKILKDLKQLFEYIPQLISIDKYTQSEIEVNSGCLIFALIELTQSITQIVTQHRKMEQFDISGYLRYLLQILPRFNMMDQTSIVYIKLEQIGQLISILSTAQLEVTPQLQSLAMYLNISYAQLPQTQSVLFQQLLKNYKAGFLTAVQLFTRELKTNTKMENRSSLSKQLKSLLEESYAMFTSNPIPLYCLLETSTTIGQSYHLSTVCNFIVNHKLQHNQQFLQLIVELLNQCMKIESQIIIEELFDIVNQFLLDWQDYNLQTINVIYELAITKPRSVQKSISTVYCYFILQTKLQDCNLIFIKETILGVNQWKYIWKIEQNKSVLVYLVDICSCALEQHAISIDIRVIIDIIYYIIENNTREEVSELVPYILRVIVKLSLNTNLDNYLLKAISMSIKIDQLFSLLISELSSLEPNRIKPILKKCIYEFSMPLLCYFQVIAQLIELSDTIEEIVELIPQLNQILRTTMLDDGALAYAQMMYLKLNQLKEYVPLNKIDMFCQSLTLLQNNF